MTKAAFQSSQDAYRHLITRVTAPIAVVVGLLLCSLFATLIVVADYQTSTAQTQQAKLAEGAIAVRSKYLERTALDYGSWNESVEHLVRHPDKDWADVNIGKATFENLGFDMTFVVAQDGTTTYAMIDGIRVDKPFGDVLNHGFDLLLAKQKAQAEKTPVSGLVMANGRPALVTISPIRYFTPDQPDYTPTHVLVLVDVIDPAMLKDIGHVYLLPRLSFAATAPDAKTPSIPLQTTDKQTIGFLTWDGDRPGDTLLGTAVPVWLVVAAAFVILTGTILRQARSTAKMIVEREQQAKHDGLTALPNRMFLFERLEVALRELQTGAPGFAVAYVDLDGFKSVNDRWGHDAGDEVLRVVARRIRLVVGDENFLARIGGDEFALILPNISYTRDVVTTGRAIINALEQPILVKDIVPVMISATIGVTFAPADGEDPLLLLRKADEALYAGKSGGKRQVRFYAASAKEPAQAPPLPEQAG